MNKTEPMRRRGKGQTNRVRVAFETTLTNGKVVVAYSQWVEGRSSLPYASIEQAKRAHMDELVKSAAITGEKVVRLDVYEEVETIQLVEEVYTKRSLVELNERARGELWR